MCRCFWLRFDIDPQKDRQFIFALARKLKPAKKCGQFRIEKRSAIGSLTNGFCAPHNIKSIQISHTPMNTSSQLKALRGPLTALVAAVALFSIAGCGSTSTLKNTQGQAITSTRKFTKVTVKTFKLQLEDKEPEMNSEKSPAYFADRIAFEIKTKGGFASVGRDTKPDANTLVID